MAAATAERVDVYRPSRGPIKSRPVGVDIIYKYTAVMVNAAGYLVPAADTANCFNAGVALETVDNSAGDVGDKMCLVDEGGAELKITQTDGSMTEANVGDPAYADNDQESKNAGNVLQGELSEYVSATVMWLRLKPFGVAS